MLDKALFYIFWTKIKEFFLKWREYPRRCGVTPSATPLHRQTSGGIVEAATTVRDTGAVVWRRRGRPQRRCGGPRGIPCPCTRAWSRARWPVHTCRGTTRWPGVADTLHLRQRRRGRRHGANWIRRGEDAAKREGPKWGRRRCRSGSSTARDVRSCCGSRSVRSGRRRDRPGVPNWCCCSPILRFGGEVERRTGWRGAARHSHHFEISHLFQHGNYKIIPMVCYNQLHNFCSIYRQCHVFRYLSANYMIF